MWLARHCCWFVPCVLLYGTVSLLGATAQFANAEAPVVLVVHNVPAVKIEGIKLMPGLNYWQEKGWRVELRGSEFWALPPEGARNPMRQSDPMRLTLDGGATHPKAK